MGNAHDRRGLLGRTTASRCGVALAEALRSLFAAALLSLLAAPPPLAAARDATRVPATAANGGPAATAANGGPAAAAATVRLATLREIRVLPQREAAATVVPRNESRLSAEISAAVVAIDADAGQPVRKGQALVRLDDADFRLALERAQAQRESLVARLRLAEVQLERGMELQRQGFVSADALAQRQAEVASLRADLRAAAAQVDTARQQLARTVVRAPFDGAVRTRHAQLGEFAVPGTPLLTLTEAGREEVSAAIPAADAATLAQAGGFAFESAQSSRPLKLLRVAPMVDRATRTREARFAFVGAALPAGTEGRALWRDPRPHLPADVVVRRGGLLGVFAVVDERARFVALPQAQEGRPALAPPGLPDAIVVSGQAALQDGQTVAPR